jgi:hypothetical protein
MLQKHPQKNTAFWENLAIWLRTRRGLLIVHTLGGVICLNLAIASFASIIEFDGWSSITEILPFVAALIASGLGGWLFGLTVSARVPGYELRQAHQLGILWFLASGMTFSLFLPLLILAPFGGAAVALMITAISAGMKRLGALLAQVTVVIITLSLLNGVVSSAMIFPYSLLSTALAGLVGAFVLDRLLPSHLLYQEVNFIGTVLRGQVEVSEDGYRVAFRQRDEG